MKDESSEFSVGVTGNVGGSAVVAVLQKSG